MEKEQVKEWLKNAHYAEKKIQLLDQIINKNKENIKKYGKCEKDKELEQNIMKQREELVKFTNDISEAINKLNNYELQTVLIYRYLLFYTVEKTADLIHYDVRTTYKKIKKAIDTLTTLLNQDEGI